MDSYYYTMDGACKTGKIVGPPQAARVQKVQKVQRVQRGRYRRFAADFEKGARLTAQVGAA